MITLETILDRIDNMDHLIDYRNMDELKEMIIAWNSYNEQCFKEYKESIESALKREGIKSLDEI